MTTDRAGLPTITQRILDALNGTPYYGYVASQLRALAAPDEPVGLDVKRLLGDLTDDDVIYDHPVSMTGEPMDPVLFVRWDFIAARLREDGPVLVRDIHVEFRDDVDPGES